MKARLFLVSGLMLLGCPLWTNGQVIDRILLGQGQSEESHGLTAYCPEQLHVVEGFLGQQGRSCLPFEGNPFAGDYPGIYGGEYCFVLRVDGNRQNYLTLRTYGGDGTVASERYRVQIGNKDLMDYSREAVSFDKQKAPGAFAYNTLILPRKLTDGKDHVVIRIRSVGRYYAYGTQGKFESYQRVMEGEMPPIYAAYTSTNPMFGRLDDEPSGKVEDYVSAPSKSSSVDLDVLKRQIEDGFNTAMANEIDGWDFKPAYMNNYFNILECMGTAYQKGYYGKGKKPSDLAAKIKVAVDSLVYINNLVKRGVNVTRSVLGTSATLQTATAGWGGLFGDQGYGMYQLWRAGQISDGYLDQKVDLGTGSGRTRREQWIEAFKESFDHGCSYSGRRQITNQVLEAAYSVYGASLALYALDASRFHNAPRLGLRFAREAVGAEFWTGVPDNYAFDGSLEDEDGYPDFQLGDFRSLDSKKNYWGLEFQIMTDKGNGREGGWTCTSCYGNLGGRILDLYLMTLSDPFIGKDANGAGDKDILAKAVLNEKSQAYFTYPWVDSEGYKQIDGEGVTCWRNRYDPGKSYYNNLVVAGVSGDEELLGHVWQSYKEGKLSVVNEMTGKTFNYNSRVYWLPECIDKLKEYGRAHDADYTAMPSVPDQPDYVYGDEQAGIVAIKHGREYLFVNFYSESSLGSCGRVHVITEHEVRNVGFVPDVMEYVPSGQTETIAEYFWNGIHKITYPDNPAMADGGTVYDIPAYDGEAGHYQEMRRQCEFYQQQLGNYIVAQNTTLDKTFRLKVASELMGCKAVDVATGEEVVLSGNMEVAPRTSMAYFLKEGNTTSGVQSVEPCQADVEALSERVDELLMFAREAADSLWDGKRDGFYSRDAYMPFFKELTYANYVAHAGITAQKGVDSVLQVLEKAYDEFLGTRYEYDACEAPGELDYRKKIAQSGALQVKGKNSIANAMNGAYVLIPVKADETGDYTIKVQARGHVYDEKNPSLNVDLYTDKQYWDDDMPLEVSKTQKIAYASMGYSEYRWYVHLSAGETVLLKYTFLADVNGYTVDLGKTSVYRSSLYDKLRQKIVSADSLLHAYDGSELVTDAQRQGLETAIEDARLVGEDAPEAEINEVYDSLVKAMALFEEGVATWKYPSADIQFRINNTGQSGDGAAFEVRHSSGGNMDYGFVGGIKFDVSGLQAENVLSATLSVVTMERGGMVSVRPFNCDWGETGGATDSYAAKQEYINEALQSEEVCQFSPALGGGRKMFEWIPDKNYRYTVKDWTVTNDITEYLKKVLGEGEHELGLLFVPADKSSTRTTIFCKDVCEETFGTSSTTGDYYLSGDMMGQSNGKTVSRWERVVQVLNQDQSPLSALKPTLTVEMKGGSGIYEIKVNGTDLLPEEVDVYNLEGRKVRTRVSFEEALHGLPKGIYIVGGKKIVVH